MHKRDCREESFDEIRAAGDFCSAFITHAYLPREVLLGLLEVGHKKLNTNSPLSLFIYFRKRGATLSDICKTSCARRIPRTTPQPLRCHARGVCRGTRAPLPCTPWRALAGGTHAPTHQT